MFVHLLFRFTVCVFVVGLLPAHLATGQFMNGVPTFFKTLNGCAYYAGAGNCCDGCIALPDGNPTWYYYKGYIIGRTQSNPANPSYFIINELINPDSTYTTSVEAEWNEQLEKHQLRPVLWTNWLEEGSGYWTDYNSFVIEEGESEIRRHFFFYLTGLLAILFSGARGEFDRAKGMKMLYIAGGLTSYRLLVFLFFEWTTSI